ncbi:MAG TPA: hypothetical protein VMU19_07985 [Bryobacteraceae bacterium]|nr:hypothetical protein [Bryobacteraceae bacterium]
MKIAALTLLLIGVAGSALAGAIVPEIDAGSAGSALALLAGAALVIRGRRRK